MTTHLNIQRSAWAGSTTAELTAYSGRKGSPFFDGQRSLVELGMRYYEGEASQGTFKLMDPDHDFVGDAFPSAHWIVTWVEDGPGFDAWLFRGRVASDEGQRGIAIIDDEVEWDIMVDDGNVDLRGQAFTVSWTRPEETDIERLVALQLYTLNGTSSTASHSRATCEVTINTSHLAPNSNTVTMPAKKYPPGTQPDEVIRDCADTAGKQFGVVIHHDGGSHLCLLYIVNDDHTTYLSPVSISDHLDEWTPDDLTAPILEPHWERGSAVIIEMQTLLSGMVGVWGPESGTFVEYAGVEEQTDYWVDVYHDGISTTQTQAANRTAGLLEGRRNSHVTNRVSVILNPDQVDLIGSGMSIQIKSATNFEDADSYFTKRIGECRFEPRIDGRYWAHLDLERPPLRVAPGRGKSGPIPPVQSEPGGDGVDPFVGTPPPPAAGTSGPDGSVGTSPIWSPIDHEHPPQTAAVTPIDDAGDYFAATDVEEALQELGATHELVSIGTPGDVSINSVTDITINTVDVDGVAAGDQLLVDAWFTILNNSSATRDITLTLDFDAAFDIELTLPALAFSSTLMHPVHMNGVLDVRASNLCYAMVFCDMQAAAGIASGTDTTAAATDLSAKGWGTNTGDRTGTVTVALFARSASATATQTLRLHSMTIQKVRPA